MIITIETTINASISEVWAAWTKAQHITKWNFASDDWHCTKAKNDLKKDGKFSSTMAAKDGSFSFDFEGTHTNVEEFKCIETLLGDGRTMKVIFEETDGSVKVTEEFEAENTNPIEMQRNGWQAILNNFKKYTESL